MDILTHRGLDLSKKEYYLENSFEAFEDQLKRGYGLEFDVSVTKDNRLVVMHDRSLLRLSNNTINKLISDINLNDFLSFRFKNCHFLEIEKLFELIRDKNNKSICAIHLKSGFQTKKIMNSLIDMMAKIDVDKYIIFDLRPENAYYIKNKNIKLHMAPSVSHEFDINRYNRFVGNTLISVDQAIRLRDVYDWIWLDEWDRNNKNGRKNFYSEETINNLKANGFKIGIVSPELHLSSPGLLAEEVHEDAINSEKLEKRLKNIIKLKPDLICTDYPDLVKGFLYENI